MICCFHIMRTNEKLPAAERSDSAQLPVPFPVRSSVSRDETASCADSTLIIQHREFFYLPRLYLKKPQRRLGLRYLSRSGVHHGRRENGNDGGVRIQHALLQNGGVLLHPPRQRHVVVFGPASQRVEQQDGPAVAALHQPLLGVLHEQGVAVMDRVPELEGEHRVCTRRRRGLDWWKETRTRKWSWQRKAGRLPAFISLNFCLSSLGVRRYWSRPSFQ